MSSARPEISLHENEIPACAIAGLDRLYGGRYASMRHFQIYGKLDNASTYICRVEETPVAILLFKIAKGMVRVLNESIHLPVVEIERFTACIFQRYRQVRSILFRAIDTVHRDLPQPSRAIFHASDMWMTAPASVDAYLKGLDGKTRQNVVRCTRNIKRDFPSFAYQVLERDAASEDVIRTILDFSRARLAAKGEVSGDDEQEIRRVIQTTRECGLVGIATIDGKICGGQVIYRFGDNFAYRATGHDPRFDPYSLGFLGCYMGACACIERQARILYMGWGTLDYKFRLGGVQRDLHDVVIFRSRASAALHSRMLLKAIGNRFLVRSRQAVKAASSMREPAPSIARFIVASARLVRLLRQSVVR